MRRCYFTILFTLIFILGYAQDYDAKSNSLGGSGVTQNTVWANFTNQANLAEIKKFTIGLNVNNPFGIKELNKRSAAFVAPTKSGVFGINIAYMGFNLYNETKIGLAFAKKISKSFNVGVQIDYLALYIDQAIQNQENFTFEIGVKKKLMQRLHLGAHIFNPISIIHNNNENIPSIFKLGLQYDPNEKVVVFTEGELKSKQDAKLKIGIEYKIIQQMQLRTGVSTNPGYNTFGIGYTLKNIQLDVAINRHQILGYSPHFSVSNSF